MWQYEEKNRTADGCVTQQFEQCIANVTMYVMLYIYQNATTLT